jgi:hypothetical protein
MAWYSRATFLTQFNVVEARCRFAIFISHQLHQQDAFVEVVGCWHTDAGGGEAVERIDFGMLPGGFLLLPAVARAFLHGAGLAAVLGLAAFGVIDGLTKTALVGLFINLGATNFVAALDDVDHRLLAAHQLAENAVHQAISDQRLNSARRFHGWLGGKWLAMKFSECMNRSC